MVMNSSSFESSIPYLFANDFKNSIVALLRYIIIAQTDPIYVVLMYCHKVSIKHHCSMSSLTHTQKSGKRPYFLHRKNCRGAVKIYVNKGEEREEGDFQMSTQLHKLH